MAKESVASAASEEPHVVSSSDEDTASRPLRGPGSRGRRGRGRGRGRIRKQGGTNRRSVSREQSVSARGRRGRTPGRAVSGRGRGNVRRRESRVLSSSTTSEEGEAPKADGLAAAAIDPVPSDAAISTEPPQSIPASPKAGPLLSQTIIEFDSESSPEREEQPEEGRAVDDDVLMQGTESTSRPSDPWMPAQAHTNTAYARYMTAEDYFWLSRTEREYQRFRSIPLYAQLPPSTSTDTALSYNAARYPTVSKEGFLVGEATELDKTFLSGDVLLETVGEARFEEHQRRISRIHEAAATQQFREKNAALLVSNMRNDVYGDFPLATVGQPHRVPQYMAMSRMPVACMYYPPRTTQPTLLPPWVPTPVAATSRPQLSVHPAHTVPSNGFDGASDQRTEHRQERYSELSDATLAQGLSPNYINALAQREYYDQASVSPSPIKPYPRRDKVYDKSRDILNDLMNAGDLSDEDHDVYLSPRVDRILVEATPNPRRTRTEQRPT